jgi:hypothetical protein
MTEKFMAAVSVLKELPKQKQTFDSVCLSAFSRDIQFNLQHSATGYRILE